MEKDIQAHLAKLGVAVEATTISAASKHAVAWVMERLPPLYVLLRETDESRYDDEITRLFQRLIMELASAGTACPAAQQLAAGIPEGVRILHERLGLPRMALRSPIPAVAVPRPRKARKVVEKK